MRYGWWLMGNAGASFHFFFGLPASLKSFGIKIKISFFVSNEKEKNRKVTEIDHNKIYKVLNEIVTKMEKLNDGKNKNKIQKRNFLHKLKISREIFGQEIGLKLMKKFF